MHKQQSSSEVSNTLRCKYAAAAHAVMASLADQQKVTGRKHLVVEIYVSLKLTAA